MSVEETTPTPEASPGMDEEAVVVFHWRVRRFRSLGFTLWQARSLAGVGADWHEAQKLLANGCPALVAFDLLS